MKKMIALVEPRVLDVIDESLDEIFGIGKKKMIYYYMEKYFCLKREEIPNNFEKFLEGLEIIFGEGAEVIKKVILKKLEEVPLKEKSL
jgi:hypothetical protein